MPSPDLRPLTLGELLDRTFTLYRNHFWLVVGIMALPEAVVVIASLGFQRLITTPGAAPFPSDPAQATARLAQMFSSVFLGLGIFMSVIYVIHSIALGATTFAVSDVYLGRSTSIGGSFAKLRGHIARLLGLNVAVFLVLFSSYFVMVLAIAILAVILGLLFKPLAILGGIVGFGLGVWFVVWVFLGFAVAVPSLLLENSGVIAALKRSSALLRGNRGRAFFVLFLMTLMTYIISIVFQGPFLVASMMLAAKGQNLSLWLAGITTVAGGVGATLSAPLLMIALALLYYDVRVRKEAFDLQIMMAQLDSAALPGSSPAPAAPLG